VVPGILFKLLLTVPQLETPLHFHDKLTSNVTPVIVVGSSQIKSQYKM